MLPEPQTDLQLRMYTDGSANCTRLGPRPRAPAAMPCVVKSKSLFVFAGTPRPFELKAKLCLEIVLRNDVEIMKRSMVTSEMQRDNHLRGVRLDDFMNTELPRRRMGHGPIFHELIGEDIRVAAPPHRYKATCGGSGALTFPSRSHADLVSLLRRLRMRKAMDSRKPEGNKTMIPAGPGRPCLNIPAVSESVPATLQTYKMI